MAKIAVDRGKSAFVKDLAAGIIKTQQTELAALRKEDGALAQKGVAAGDLGAPDHMMGMDDDPDELRTAEPFDEAFLKMMVPHHQGAITMAEAELSKGGDPELRKLAKDIKEDQQREVKAMREHLDDPDAEPGMHG